MNKNKFRAFTFMEIIIVAIILSIGLASILYSLNFGVKQVQGSKQRVMAINLAREGIESVYNIRDTNRLIQSAERDKCRLKANPLSGDIYCKDDVWLQKSFYILNRGFTGLQEYFYLDQHPNLTGLNILDGIQSSDYKYALCETGGILQSCGSSYVYSGGYIFFRQIEGKGLFLKDSDEIGGVYLDCIKGDDNPITPNIDCGGKDAKEFRFCSKVAYFGQTVGEVEICSLVTNFED